MRLKLNLLFKPGTSPDPEKIPFEKIKLPWEGGLKSASDMYLLPNTKLAKPYLDPEFKVGLCLSIDTDYDC